MEMKNFSKFRRTAILALVLGIFCISVFGQTITNITEIRVPFTQRLHLPGPLVVDSSDNIYTFDDNSRAAFRVSPSGDITQIVDFNSLIEGVSLVPRDIAIDSNDYVYFLAGRYLVRHDPAGELLTFDYSSASGISLLGERLVADSEDELFILGQQLIPDGPDLLRVSLQAGPVE